uniref:Transposase-associated domain-containing protein n=1 Tax=Cannabis sativa TaxID=3483 RepID=A0A803PSE2_CANSA
MLQAVVVSIDPRRVYINDPNDVEFKTVRVTNRVDHSVLKQSFGVVDMSPNGEEFAWYRRASNEYKEGARSFVETIEKEANYPEKLLCPCKFCRNLSHQKVNLLYEHLVINGIDPTYTIWFHHGEEAPRSDDIEEMNSFDAFNLFSATNIDVCDSEEPVEGPDDNFIKKLEDAQIALYPQCTNYTKLSAIIALYKVKTTNGWSDKSFDEILNLFHDMLPCDNALLKSTHSARKYLQTFDLGYEKIHACVNNCCLFRKDKEKLEECPTCGTSRWATDKLTNKVRKGIPAKVLRPKQLGNDIDVYLEPLIEDLNTLWNEGVELHDAFVNKTFTLRAILMWTIQDFPPMGTLPDKHDYVDCSISMDVSFERMHKDELRKTNQIYARNSGLLWKRHVETFPKWLKEKVPIDKGEENDLLKWLAYGPRKQAISCTGFIINGQRFNVEDDKRQHVWSFATREDDHEVKNVKKNKESKIQETQKMNFSKLKTLKTRRKMIVRDSSEDEETPGQEKEICSTKRKRSLRKKASRSKTPIPISLTPISNSPTVNTRSKTPQISITMPTIDSPALNTRGSLRRRSIGSSPVLDDVAPPLEEPMEKKKRGETKMKSVATSSEGRLPVKFNALGQPIGKASISLSSFLGPLVREVVPVTLPDWRKITLGMKEVLWRSIQEFSISLWSLDLGFMNYLYCSVDSFPNAGRR